MCSNIRAGLFITLTYNLETKNYNFPLHKYISHVKSGVAIVNLKRKNCIFCQWVAFLTTIVRNLSVI